MKRAVHTFSESEEMYLKTIAEMVALSAPVPITGLAERMGISTVSASEMMNKLQERGFVIRTPYKGVELSPQGEQRAKKVILRHRLWECFLVDKLGLAWARVHVLACEMEHLTEPEVTQALAEHLDWPTTCPHGNPIQYGEEAQAPDPGVRLSDLTPGQAARVLRVHPESSELLEYLQELGIFPDEVVELDSIAPFNGPFGLRTDGGTRVVGREVAGYLWVEPLP